LQKWAGGRPFTPLAAIFSSTIFEPSTFHLLTADFAIQSKEYKLHLVGENLMNGCAVFCSFGVFTKFRVSFLNQPEKISLKTASEIKVPCLLSDRPQRTI